MKEKKREEVKPAPSDGNGDSVFDAAPAPEDKSVSVSSGPYLETLPVAGMSVAQVRHKFKDRFDIDGAAAAIVDGNDADENHVLAAGENLMFVRHAGEKGALEIEGTTITATSKEGVKKSMSIARMLELTGPGIDTGSCVLPSGIKAVLSRGPMTIWVWEQAPTVQKLSWIRADSPSHYGPGTTYRNVRIGLPYLLVFGVFAKDATGLPCIIGQDECFFRTEPLKSLEDAVRFPGLLNCSKFPGQERSWICTQHLKPNPQMDSPDPGQRFAGGFEAVRYCLLETSFNLSSEHHEGNSWYGASKSIDKRIATIEAWEKETKSDPLFVLDVPWIKAKQSVKDVADRIFETNFATAAGIKNAAYIERLIYMNK